MALKAWEEYGVSVGTITMSIHVLCMLNYVAMLLQISMNVGLVSTTVSLTLSVVT